MGDVDYNVLRVLRTLGHDHPNVDHDNQMALLLQEQFNHEASTEKPSGLTYSVKSPPDKSKCLVDPSWELVDPTPNVHALFIAFRERFFWNGLLSVSVSWSKRMTSCAGICSYSPRGGMCKITLSEPLLKLRPRKDLVETLLHEMIHAYLFVTNNNKDRDGHGPEFHKHMYRINAEAGTNITVYHDFHDEVRLYKQHWWKCNGPCNTRKPFYGMVRRAQNRAPGPNDFWWAEHSRSCGGKFIKVKEPEKPQKNKKSEKKPSLPISTNKDIRSYLPTVNGVAANSVVISPKKKPTTPKSRKNNGIVSPSNSIKNYLPNQTIPSTSSSTNIPGIKNASTPKSALKNITTLFNNDNTNTHNTNSVPKTFSGNSKIQNIHGFHDIGNSSGIKNATYNGGTIIVNPKTKKSTSSGSDTGCLDTNVPIFSGSGHVLKSTSTTPQNYETVRNSWLAKFGDTSKKRLSGDEIINGGKRKCVDADLLKEHNILVNCPVCRQKVAEKELNGHLDLCLTSDNCNNYDICFICDKKIPQDQFEHHVSKCYKPETVEGFDDDMDTIGCEICNEKLSPLNMPEHLKTCLQNISASLSNDSSNFKQCDYCKTYLDEKIYDQHAANCLMQLYNDMENQFKPVENVACLVCKKLIPKDGLNSHLEDCMNDSIFLDDNEKKSFLEDNTLIEEFETTTNSVTVVSDDEVFNSQNDIDSFVNDNSLIEEYVSTKSRGKKFNCPVCDKLVLETELNQHLDSCVSN